MLHLPDAADATGVPAARTTLGRMPGSDAGASALALVSRERYFGPCASLARSRRHRRTYPRFMAESSCLLEHGSKCTIGNTMQLEPLTEACWKAIGDKHVCNDSHDDNGTPTPSVVELTAPIPVYVLHDVAPLLVAINADVRTSDTTVEGVLGTEALQRMVATIDYPGRRMIARCVDDANCKAYPRLSLPSPNDCGFCEGADTVNACGVSLGACAVAPAASTP
jgi:hypothetical protein